MGFINKCDKQRTLVKVSFELRGNSSENSIWRLGSAAMVQSLSMQHAAHAIHGVN